MRKKITILLGISIVFLSLFINLIISKDTELSELAITNIEALAQNEGSNPTFKIDCDDVGYICIGIDKRGVKGKHPGLDRITQ